MKVQKKRKLIYILISLFLSIVLNLILIYLVRSNMDSMNTVCLWGLGSIYLAAFFYLILYKCSAYSIRKNKSLFLSITSISVLVTFILLFLLPFRFGQVLKSNVLEKLLNKNSKIEIEVLNQKNENSAGNAVWLEGIIVDNKDYNLYEIPITDGWERIDGRIAAMDFNAEKLTVDLPAHDIFSIMFRHQNDAGMIRIKIGNYEHTYDLYHTEFDQRAELDLSNLIEVGYDTQIMKQRFVFYVIEAIILWSISFNIIAYLMTSYLNKKYIITAYEK